MLQLNINLCQAMLDVTREKFSLNKISRAGISLVEVYKITTAPPTTTTLCMDIPIYRRLASTKQSGQNLKD